MERIDQHCTDLPGGKEYVIDDFYDDGIFLHPNAKLEIVSKSLYRPVYAQAHSEVIVRGAAEKIVMQPHSKIYIYGSIHKLELRSAEAHIYGGNVHHLDVTDGKVYFYGRGAYCHRLTAVESHVFTRKSNHIRHITLNDTELCVSNDTALNDIVVCGAPSLIRHRIKGETAMDFIKRFHLNPDEVVVKHESA